AEGAGFEPARRFITVYTLSRRAPSTARPPLQGATETSGPVKGAQFTAYRAKSCRGAVERRGREQPNLLPSAGRRGRRGSRAHAPVERPSGSQSCPPRAAARRAQSAPVSRRGGAQSR